MPEPEHKSGIAEVLRKASFSLTALAGLTASVLSDTLSMQRDTTDIPVPAAAKPADEGVVIGASVANEQIRSPLVDKERAKRRLILIGGGEPPVEALSRFVEWSGREDAKILVIPWATAHTVESYRSVESALAVFQPASIECAPNAREMADPQRKTDFLEQLRKATGLYFTGGDQNEIMAVAADRRILEAIRSRFHEGLVCAGTSAGTAVMSQTMLTGNGDFTVIDPTKVETAAGLGLLEGAIVDQHFIRRSRMNRLMSVMSGAVEPLGIGVDEDTALSIEDNRIAEVVGPGDVVVIDKIERPGKMVVELLHPGERFDLETAEKIGRREADPPVNHGVVAPPPAH